MRLPRSISNGLITLLRDGSAWLGYLWLVLPSLIVVPISFGDKNEFIFPPERWSFFLYEKIISDRGWMDSIGLSVVLAVISAVLAVIIGIGAAYAASRSTCSGKGAISGLLLSPMFVPHIVLALGLYLYFGQLKLTGTFLSLIIAHTVLSLPFVIVTLLAGLQQVDVSLENVSRVMGASRLTILRSVTLPLLRPSIVAAGAFAFLLSFDEVVVSYFLASPAYQPLPVKMYSSIMFELSPVLAAISTLLTVLSLAICLFVAVPKEKSR